MSDPAPTLFESVAASGKSLAEQSGLSEQSIRVLYATAVGHFEAGRLQQAQVVLMQLLALAPKVEDHWALLGNTLMRLGQFAEAVTAWEMAMACQPRYATAVRIARTAIAIGRLDAAAEALLMARKYAQSPAQQEEFDALIEAWYAARNSAAPKE